MAKLLAANALDIAHFLRFYLFCQEFLIDHGVFFALSVFLELAPGLVLSSFTATPPHFTARLRLVDPT